jgi:dTDP-D-glucose 4,6-dehydratase
VLGYRQHPEKFLPLLISKIVRDEEIVIHGTADLKSAGTRFYIDARDVADAVLMLLESNEFGKFNVVGERETSNLSLASWVADFLRKPLRHRIVNANTARPGHDLRYAMDGGLLEAKFGWKPAVAIEDRVGEIVSWTLRNPQWLL